MPKQLVCGFIAARNTLLLAHRSRRPRSAIQRLRVRTQSTMHLHDLAPIFEPYHMRSCATSVEAADSILKLRSEFRRSGSHNLARVQSHMKLCYRPIIQSMFLCTANGIKLNMIAIRYDDKSASTLLHWTQESTFNFRFREICVSSPNKCSEPQPDSSKWLGESL